MQTPSLQVVEDSPQVLEENHRLLLHSPLCVLIVPPLAATSRSTATPVGPHCLRHGPRWIDNTPLVLSESNWKRMGGWTDGDSTNPHGLIPMAARAQKKAVWGESEEARRSAEVITKAPPIQPCGGLYTTRGTCATPQVSTD